MVGLDDIVITGLGCVSPVGIGRESFQQSLLAHRCAIGQLIQLEDDVRTTYYGATVDDFDGKQFVTPRKALKVMSREVQIAYSAAHLAWSDAGLVDFVSTPERMAVIYGSEVIAGDEGDLLSAVRACSQDQVIDHSRWGRQFGKEIYPLWMLKNLPNMPACHVGIAIDARGPNNTIAQEEVSGLLALAEASCIIQRGDADLVVVGAVGSRVSPTRLAFRPAHLFDQHGYDEATASEPRCVPFDARRRGIVPSEAAAAIILERRSHAVRRGAPIIGQLCSCSSRCVAPRQRFGGSRESIAAALDTALASAGVEADQLAHVSAQGYSHPQLDIEEAAAIERSVGRVPVTAFSSYFGTAGAASALLQLIASIVAVRSGKTLLTHGFQHADSSCSANVASTDRSTDNAHALQVAFTPHGQAAAAVVKCEIQPT